MSAGTGQGALDALSPTDNNPNSVYTRTLLPLLKEPGLEVTDLAKRVRSQVETLASSIQFDQRPAFYHELSGDFYLSEPRAAPAVAAGPTGLSEAAQAWSSAKDSSDPALLKAYIQQFGGTFYAGLAQARLDEVEKSRRGQPGVTAPVSPLPVASATRPSQPAAAMPPAVKPPTAMGIRAGVDRDTKQQGRNPRSSSSLGVMATAFMPEWRANIWTPSGETARR